MLDLGGDPPSLAAWEIPRLHSYQLNWTLQGLHAMGEAVSSLQNYFRGAPTLLWGTGRRAAHTFTPEAFDMLLGR